MNQSSHCVREVPVGLWREQKFGWSPGGEEDCAFWYKMIQIVSYWGCTTAWLVASQIFPVVKGMSSETGAVYILCSWVSGEEIFQTKVLSDLCMYWQFCSTLWVGVWFYVLTQEYDRRVRRGAGCSSVLPFVPLDAQSWNFWLFCERVQSPQSLLGWRVLYNGKCCTLFVLKRVSLQN